MTHLLPVMERGELLALQAKSGDKEHFLQEDVGKATVYGVDLAIVSSLILAPVSWKVIRSMFSDVINVAKGIAGRVGRKLF